MIGFTFDKYFFSTIFPTRPRYIHLNEILEIPYQVLNVSVDIFLHARSSSCDPSTKRAELHGIWFVPRTVALLSQLQIKTHTLEPQFYGHSFERSL